MYVVLYETMYDGDGDGDDDDDDDYDDDDFMISMSVRNVEEFCAQRRPVELTLSYFPM